jgi:hypothetical protein
MSTTNAVATINKKPQLPALIKDLGLAVKVDNFNSLMNTPPPRDWFKNYKGNDYLPIDRVKNNLIIIFQDYDWCIKDVKVVANSILVYGTLSVVNPVTGKTRNIDGVGAVPIQLKSGSNPTDFSQIIGDAIQKNAPAADSFAFKNAAQKLGKLFGGGSDDIEFTPRYSAEVDIEGIKSGINASN